MQCAAALNGVDLVADDVSANHMHNGHGTKGTSLSFAVTSLVRFGVPSSPYVALRIWKPIPTASERVLGLPLGHTGRLDALVSLFGGLDHLGVAPQVLHPRLLVRRVLAVNDQGALQILVDQLDGVGFHTRGDLEAEECDDLTLVSTEEPLDYFCLK